MNLGMYHLTRSHRVLRIPGSLPIFEQIRRWADNLHKYRRVRSTRVGRAEVSTVFLGMDLSPLSLRPQCFETAVIDKSGAVRVAARYYTWDSAVRGHAQIVASERVLLFSSARNRKR
jgi:hypothetical protein